MAVQRKQTIKPLNSWLVVFLVVCFIFYFNDSSVFQVSPVASSEMVVKDLVWRCLVLNVASQRQGKSFIFIPSSEVFCDYLVFVFSFYSFLCPILKCDLLDTSTQLVVLVVKTCQVFSRTLYWHLKHRPGSALPSCDLKGEAAFP